MPTKTAGGTPVVITGFASGPKERQAMLYVVVNRGKLDHTVTVRSASLKKPTEFDSKESEDALSSIVFEDTANEPETEKSQRVGLPEGDVN